MRVCSVVSLLTFSGWSCLSVMTRGKAIYCQLLIPGCVRATRWPKRYSKMPNSGGANKPVISDVARKIPMLKIKKPTETDQPPTLAMATAAGTCSAMSFARRFASYALPHWLFVGMMLSMIFGGCCSNVRTCSLVQALGWT